MDDDATTADATHVVPVGRQVGALLFEVTGLVRRIAERSLVDEVGVTLSQFLLLQGIETGGAPNQREIGDRLGIDRAAVSRQLARLESAGLVVRTPGSRATVVRLSGEGEHRLAHGRDVMQRSVAPAYGAVGDIPEFVRALARLRDALAETRR